MAKKRLSSVIDWSNDYRPEVSIPGVKTLTQAETEAYWSRHCEDVNRPQLYRSQVVQGGPADQLAVLMKELRDEQEADSSRDGPDR